jgi:hypothetical protein
MEKIKNKRSLVVTSIAAPNKALKELSLGAIQCGVEFYVIGDMKTPKDFQLQGSNFIDTSEQERFDLKLPGFLPYNHYTRKNVGYLLAIQNGATIILETDNDNLPYNEFWDAREVDTEAFVIENEGWLNIYRYFTDKQIWPRGFSLQHIQKVPPKLSEKSRKIVTCPIQQGLVDNDPDVDAIFRLAFPLPVKFEGEHKLALGRDTWCPFNSQNTTWFQDAFPLLYLPSYCSFRMTDIWRSFVAQRIMWECGWHLLFHKPTMWQERNDHNLMADFRDEVSGYLNNDMIVKKLDAVHLKRGVAFIGENLISCYEKLVEIGVVGAKEMPLVHAWVSDLESFGIMLET